MNTSRGHVAITTTALLLTALAVLATSLGALWGALDWRWILTAAGVGFVVAVACGAVDNHLAARDLRRARSHGK